MKQRVTISFVEDVEYDSGEVFWSVIARESLPKWSDTASEINVSVEPIDEATPLQSQVAEFLKRHGDEYFKDLDFRNSATAALNNFIASQGWPRTIISSRNAGKTAAMEMCSDEYVARLRRHYGCDDGGAQ